MTTAVPFDFVPLGAAVVRDPYPIYDRMREAGRVLQTPYGVTLVHRYDDVRQVHLDHDRYSMGALQGLMAMMGPGEGTDGSVGGGLVGLGKVPGSDACWSGE